MREKAKALRNILTRFNCKNTALNSPGQKWCKIIYLTIKARGLSSWMDDNFSLWPFSLDQGIIAHSIDDFPDHNPSINWIGPSKPVSLSPTINLRSRRIYILCSLTITMINGETKKVTIRTLYFFCQQKKYTFLSL